MSEFVDQNYYHDPETEDLILGTGLKNGMKVLLEANYFRSAIRKNVDEQPETNILMTINKTQKAKKMLASGYAQAEVATALGVSIRTLRKSLDELAIALKYNRWMTVTDFSNDDDQISFIGVYEDNTVANHSYYDSHGWYVKRDSISSVVSAPNKELVMVKFVDQHYTMDPKTETLIYGFHLKNGMIVLAESAASRSMVSRATNEYPNELANALKYNRWVIVTELSKKNDQTDFVGICEDGMKVYHSNNDGDGWYVKLDSIPKVEESAEIDYGFVEKFYRMDPKTEDLILGTELKNGMRVLAEAEYNRVSDLANVHLYPAEFAKALKYNRWMTVEKVSKKKVRNFFVGAYDDGTKTRHGHLLDDDAWYVKRDSISVVKEPKDIELSDVWYDIQMLNKKVDEVIRVLYKEQTSS